MNYEKAHAELLKGKKIRRKEWPILTHLRMVDDKVIAFQGEYTAYYQGPTILTTTGWKVVDGDGSSLTFVEAIEELKLKKCITRDEWGDMFLFVDKDQLAICKAVEFDFMPSWRCLLNSDWECMK